MKTVRVQVLQYNELSFDKFSDLLEFVDGLRQQIPAEYHAAAVVDIESDYESSYVTMGLYYDRPQTAEEAAKEAAELEKAREELRTRHEREAVAREKRDRAEYVRLKAKYS